MSIGLARVRAQIEEAIRVKASLLADTGLLTSIGQVTDVVVTALGRGGKIFFAGNGGSAADAQHLAAEFVSRFAFDRPGLAAQSLATDTSIITAIGNDYGYERLFARQLQANARKQDVFFGITTSGRSKNIIAAFQECRALGLTSVALAGTGGDLEGNVDYVLRVPSAETARIQECHILIGHVICAEVELRLFSGDIS
jgi:D-sedoheptulose 7-phosphate isomerase